MMISLNIYSPVFTSGKDQLLCSSAPIIHCTNDEYWQFTSHMVPQNGSTGQSIPEIIEANMPECK